MSHPAWCVVVEAHSDEDCHTSSDLWQHVKPHRHLDHTVLPIRSKSGLTAFISGRKVCRFCYGEIKEVDKSEGPEELRARFPL